MKAGSAEGGWTAQGLNGAMNTRITETGRARCSVPKMRVSVCRAGG